MGGVVHSHFARRLGPVDVHLLLRLAGEARHGHNPIVLPLVVGRVAAVLLVVLRLQSPTSHLTLSKFAI